MSRSLDDEVRATNQLVDTYTVTNVGRNVGTHHDPTQHRSFDVSVDERASDNRSNCTASNDPDSHVVEGTSDLIHAVGEPETRIVWWVILDELQDVLRSRRDADPSGSYTAQLLADPELIQRKIMEEAFEVCLEIARPETAKNLVAEEAADVIYHLLVGLTAVDVPLADVFAVLEGRRS